MKKTLYVLFTSLILLLLVGCTSKTKKYDMSLVEFSDKTIQFDNQEHTFEISGHLPYGVSVSYTENKFKEIGTYQVTASFTGDSKHEPIPDMSASLTIAKKEINLSNKSYTLLYDEKAHEITPSFSGKLTGYDVEYDISYSGEIKEVGSYTATITLKDDSVYSLTNGNIDIKVVKETFNVTFKSDGKDDIVYQVPYGDNLENYTEPFCSDGYTTSWDQDKSVLENIKENKTINVTLTPIEYKVAFNNNLPLDEEFKEDCTIKYNSSLENIMVDETTIDGYIFKGWSKTRNGEVLFNRTDNYTLTEDTTLYAIYDKKFILSGNTLTGINSDYYDTTILDIPSKNYTWTETEVTSTDVKYITTEYSLSHYCNKKNVKTLIIPKTIESVRSNYGYSKAPFEGLDWVEDVYFDAKNLNYEPAALSATLFYFFGYGTDAHPTFHVGENVEEMNFTLKGSYFKSIDCSKATKLKVLGKSFMANVATSISLPTSITTIEKNALHSQKGPVTIYYAGTAEDFAKIEIDSSNDGEYTVIYTNQN